MKEKRKTLLFSLIIFSITFTFCASFYLAVPDYSLIGKSDREKLIELLPGYYELLFFAYDNAEPGSTVLFLESDYYAYAVPLYYPIIQCDYLQFDPEDISDQEVLDYLKNNVIDYLLIFYIDFPLSTNSTYFTKHPFDSSLDSSRYLLDINRTAL